MQSEGRGLAPRLHNQGLREGSGLQAKEFGFYPASAGLQRLHLAQRRNGAVRR